MLREKQNKTPLFTEKYRLISFKEHGNITIRYNLTPDNLLGLITVYILLPLRQHESRELVLQYQFFVNLFFPSYNTLFLLLFSGVVISTVTVLECF